MPARERLEELSKSRGFRLAKGVLFWIVALELGYILAANTLLASGLVQKTLNDTGSAHLEFSSSYSVIPTQVHVTDLRLRYEDHNMQFAFSLAEADVTINVLWLLKKRFSTSSVRASGVKFLFRHKVAQVAGNEGALALYPPIPGFADPPLLGVPEVSNPEELWSFELNNVDAAINELWFMAYRYLGPARATGGFQLIPQRNLEVGPAHLSLFSGTLHSGAQVIVSHNLRAEVDLYLRPINPEALTGMTVFEPIAAEVQLGMRLINLEAVNLYLPDVPQMRVTQGGGNLEVAAKFVGGKLGAGSSIRYAMLDPVRVERSGLVVESTVILNLSVADTKAAQFLVSAERADLFSQGGSTADTLSLAVAERVHWVTDFSELDLTQALEPSRVRLDIPVLAAHHLQRLDPLFQGSRGWHLLGGSAVFSGSAEVHEGVTQAELKGDFEALRGQVEEHEFWAFGTVAAAYRANEEEQSSQVENAELLFTNITARSQDRRTADWWASVSTNKLQLTGAPGKQLGGTLVARAKNADPVLNALDVPRVARVLVPDRPVEAVAKLERQGEVSRLKLLHARTGSLNVRGEVVRKAQRTDGAFRVEGIAVPIGIEIEDGESGLTLLASEAWLEERLQNLGTTPRIKPQVSSRRIKPRSVRGAPTVMVSQRAVVTVDNARLSRD